MPSPARIKLIAVGFLTACMVQAALWFVGLVFTKPEPFGTILLLLLKSVPVLLNNGWHYGLFLAIAAAVPAAIVIWITEHFALRRLVYHLVASIALVSLFFGGDLLRWSSDPWWGRNAGQHYAAAFFSGIVYWMIAGRSAGSTDGLESNRFIPHLVTIFLALMAACIAIPVAGGVIGMVTTFGNQILTFRDFLIGAQYAIYLTSLFGSPFLLWVIAAECFRIRSAFFYWLAGFAIFLLQATWLYWFSTITPTYEFSQIVFMVVFMVINGVVFGLTYWAIAGRHAGQWRREQVQ